MLINAAKAHINNVKVQARVVRALTNLSVHEENKARPLPLPAFYPTCSTTSYSHPPASSTAYLLPYHLPCLLYLEPTSYPTSSTRRALHRRLGL